MSIKEGLDDAQNLDVEASNQIDGSRRIANQINVHQLTSSRSGLADIANVLLEDQFADVWRGRSIAADANDEGESLEVSKRKSKATQRWVHYQLDELLKKRSSYNDKIIRKSSTIEGMMYSPRNIEPVRDQMQQLDDIFKVMLDVQKEYHSLLLAEEQERDEEWFDIVDHNICIFKQKVHCWIKDVELERKTNLSSRRSHVSGGFGRSSSKHSSKSSRSNKSSREEKALAEKIEMVELMVEAKFMEERQSLVFQTERLKVAEEMARKKARVQILEDPCDEIVERNEEVTGMRSLLHKTFNHQNDPGRTRAVSVDGKSSIANMDSSASRESHVGYHKDVSRQDVSVRRIGINGRPLQDQMNTREPVEDVHFRNRNSSNDEDANHKTSSVLCKLLQQ